MVKLNDNNLACVHCGGRVKALFKRYSPSVLKLINCDNCSFVADKYIEYDNVIILIDLILFKTQAYRHIIFNSEFKNHWKLAVLILLVSTYAEWATHCSFDIEGLRPMVLEHTFYVSFLISLTGKVVYSSIVLLVILLYEKGETMSKGEFLTLSWKALVLSNFGQFLVLPSLIWTDIYRELHVLLVAMYCLLSQVQAFSVVCRLSKRSLMAVSVLALWAEQTIMVFGRNVF